MKYFKYLTFPFLLLVFMAQGAMLGLLMGAFACSFYVNKRITFWRINWDRIEVLLKSDGTL